MAARVNQSSGALTEQTDLQRRALALNEAGVTWARVASACSMSTASMYRFKDGMYVGADSVHALKRGIAQLEAKTMPPKPAPAAPPKVRCVLICTFDGGKSNELGQLQAIAHVLGFGLEVWRPQ